MLGMMLAGVFCAPNLGLFSGNGFSDGITSIGGQMAIQGIAVVATFVYTAVASWILFKVIDAVVGLRVGEEEETIGLDLVLHDERGYDL
jgi:Amt family ammonium transporter